MTKKQRKYLLYRIRVAACKNVKWMELLQFVPISFWPKEITKRIMRKF